MKRFPDLASRLAARKPDGERPVIMHHRWEALLFLHWRVSADQIQATLPDGLTVDTFEGAAYLTISPFFMRKVRPVGLPPLPWLSEFQELNVRAYVFDECGVPGIWFYSLDCDQPLAVTGARVLTGLPYFSAEMAADMNGAIDYSCRREGTEHPARYRYRGVGAAREAHPESLEFFLLEQLLSLFAARRFACAQSGQSRSLPLPEDRCRNIVVPSGPAQWVHSSRSRGAGLLRRWLRRSGLRDPRARLRCIG